MRTHHCSSALPLRPRPALRAGWLLLFLLLPTTPVLAAPGEPGDGLVTTWAQVRARLRGLYLARLTLAARADGQLELCARPTRNLLGRGGPAGQICSRAADILGWSTPGFHGEPGLAYVATMPTGGREVIAAVAGCGGQCDKVPESALVTQVRCGQLDRFWSSLPRRDLTCSTDRECTLLLGSCFERAVSARAAPHYRDVLRRLGGRCQHPAAGECAPSKGRAVCQQGTCTTAAPAEPKLGATSKGPAACKRDTDCVLIHPRCGCGSPGDRAAGRLCRQVWPLAVGRNEASRLVKKGCPCPCSTRPAKARCVERRCAARPPPAEGAADLTVR